MTVQRPPGHVEIRRAAAGILYRETEKTVNIYLARRYPGASFFPGYYAFVGGTLEQGDGDPEQDETFRLCVLREFMEELGVMIGKKGDVNPADKEDVRENLREGSMTVREGFDRMGRDPAPECMKPAGRFLTPDFVPVRYDTKYYAVPCPEGVEPDVRGPELTSGAWFTPEGALEKWRRGEMLIAPPVLLLLRSFAEKGFSKGLEEWAGVNTAGTDREPYIEMRPGIRFLPLETPNYSSFPNDKHNCYRGGPVLCRGSGNTTRKRTGTIAEFDRSYAP